MINLITQAFKKITLFGIVDGVSFSFASMMGIDANMQEELFKNIADTSSPVYKIGLWVSLTWLFTRIIGEVINKYYETKKNKIELKILQEELNQIEKNKKDKIIKPN